MRSFDRGALARRERRPLGPLQAGFTYLAMLIGVAVIGVGLAATGEVWSQSAQREKEQQLLFIGEEFREALERYYRESPGSMQRYPKTLDELVKDPRHATVKRHLRRIYRDPMTGGTEWGLVLAPEGGIIGVHSLSQQAPLKSGNFARGEPETFRQAQRYADWLFVHEGAAQPTPPQPGAAQPTGSQANAPGASSPSAAPAQGSAARP